MREKVPEVVQFGQPLDLSNKELGYLLGVSERTIRRGINGGPAQVLLDVLKSRMADPRSTQSARALVLITARRGGLKALLEAMFEGYVTMDLLRLR